uniref:CUB domain-containing protein n=1 Tax=Tetranychus urticae TaxID=32264 RepID=T1KK98_TETUR
MSRRAILYSQGNILTLSIILQDGRAFFSQYLPLNIYLTYRFLSASALPKQPTHSESIHNTEIGMKLPENLCNQIFDDCLEPNKCRLLSPNYPGFYPRNKTCHYLIRQKVDSSQIGSGLGPRITINQSNEYKISIFSGSSSTNNGKQTRTGLISDCPLDRVTVYDGPSTSSPRLLQFCGTGALPTLTSSKGEMLLVLTSVQDNALSDSRFEINIQVNMVKKEVNREVSKTGQGGGRVDAREGIGLGSTRRVESDLNPLGYPKCEYIYDGSVSRSGRIEATVAPSTAHNTSCLYRFTSPYSFDKIWLRFISYFTEDSHPWSTEEKCDSGEMKISEIRQQQKLIGHFCEKISPKICGRAFTGYNSMVPCSYPKESYLSKGPNLLISQFQRRLPGLTYLPTKFTAQYEFIDTAESGEPIIGTLCDRRFTSTQSLSGHIWSSRNVFYYGRGGNSDVSCSYYFNGRVGEKLVLRLTSLKLSTSTCQQATNGPVQTYSCYPGSSSPSQSTTRGKAAYKRVKERNKFSPLLPSSPPHPTSSTSPSSSSLQSNLITSSTLRVYDSVTNELLSVACFCDSANLTATISSPIILNLIGPHSVLNFTITGMSSLHDFTDFHFEGKYEFVANNYCTTNAIDLIKSDGEGEISYTVPSDHNFSNNNQFKCRWIFVWYPNKFVSLHINGYRPRRGQKCESKNRFIIYWDSPWRPMATICARSNSTGLDGVGNDHVETINLSLSLMQERSSSWSSMTSPVSPRSTLVPPNEHNNFASSSTPNQDQHYYQSRPQDSMYPSSPISFFNSSSLRFIIEIIAETPSATFNFRWVTQKTPVNARKTETSETLRNTDCLYKCPEFNFCLSPDLLCDGVKHCPSGYDESNVFCSSSFLLVYCFLALVTMVAIVAGILYSIVRTLKRRSNQLSSIHDNHSCQPPATICSLFDGQGSTSTGSLCSSTLHNRNSTSSPSAYLTSSTTQGPATLSTLNEFESELMGVYSDNCDRNV